jgi:long-chain acyl-CoA synthetase
MNAADFLLAHRDSGRPAIVQGDRTVSHRELAARVDRAAAALRAADLRPGSVAGLVGDASVEWVVSYLAVMRCGAAAMPVAGGDSARVLAGALAIPGVTHVLCDGRYAARVREFAPPGVAVLVDGPGEGRPSPGAVPDVDLGDPRRALAAVMMTSGSTGDPKGVRVSHRNVVANTESIVSCLGLTAEDRMAVVLPFHYCFGLSLLHTHLRAGGSVFLAGGFTFPEQVLDELVARQCTGFAGVPSTYQTLLRRTAFVRRSLGALRHLQQAGGRLAPALAREVLAALPAGAKLFVMYGATEATARLSCVPPDRLPEKLGTIGVPIPGVSFELRDARGQPVPDGEVGEIVAAGDNITLGYVGDEALTARRFREGRFFTGDLARRDRDGFFVVESRESDFIKSHGFRISPHELEDVLLELPEVQEALVAGVPDDEAGEAVVAFVVAAPEHEPTEARLRRHCLERLPRHKVPASFRLCASLPKTAAGKVPRAEAVRLLASADVPGTA